MRIKFWGVRGSIPCPGCDTIKYGGNTPCIELYFKEVNRLIIIDAGSGIRELGNHMIAHDLQKGRIRADIFLTHTHIDHIIGFPFFAPIHVPDTTLKIYGPVTYENESLKDVLGGQLTYRYFPVRLTELAADIEYINLQEGCLNLGDGIKLTAKYLNHPILCFGYRFEYRSKIFCTIYDTEPFQNIFCTDPENPLYDEAMAMEGNRTAWEENKRVEEFFAGADLLVYDAQYDQKEYDTGKIGWGHTPIEYAIEAAGRSSVKQLSLFHHDPMRTDEQLDFLSDKFCCPENKETPEIFFAREGMTIKL